MFAFENIPDPDYNRELPVGVGGLGRWRWEWVVFGWTQWWDAPLRR